MTSKRMQVQKIKRALKRQGYDVDKIDVEALVDSRLSYRENLRNIKRQLRSSGRKRNENLRDLYDQLMQAVQYRQMSRSEMAQTVDNRTKSRIIVKQGGRITKRKIRNIEKWLENPNRVDIEGVDYFPGYSKKRRKKSKRKTRSGRKKGKRKTRSRGRKKK